MGSRLQLVSSPGIWFEDGLLGITQTLVHSQHLTPKREFASSSLCLAPKIAGWPGRYINVRQCGRLSMVLLQLKDPLELFEKEKGISSRF